MAGLVLLIAPLMLSPSFAADSFVNKQDRRCLGKKPCFSSIQEAIDQALSGDHIQIQPGVYHEQLLIRDKNDFAGASHTDRIVVGRAEGAPVDSVILDGKTIGGGCGVGAIQLSRSRYISITGMVIRGFAGPAIQLQGGPNENTAIHIERNRIFGNGGKECNGGVVIEKGNPDTLVVNNLIYVNGGNGIELSPGPGRGLGVPPKTQEKQRDSGRRLGVGLDIGGPHYLIQNTIHGNGRNGVAVSQGQWAILANNSVTGNGVFGPRGRRQGLRVGYGVVRDASQHQRESQITLMNNLLCGNALGEAHGPVFVGTHADNLTPKGTEAPGVLASPECVPPDGVYENVKGVDGLSGTLDDDFTLSGPGEQGMPSPAIDRGIDPRTLGLEKALDPLLLADFLAPDVRPIQRDVNRPLDFDIGALEISCSCFENCESCQIVIHADGSSVDQCKATYNLETECCNRITGAVSSKEIPHAYDVCPDTRTPKSGFDPEATADGCSAVSDTPLAACPSVRFGCDEDSGEANCPEGIDLPCNHHDFCYQTCGRTKAECDSAFLDDMFRVCNEMTAAQKAVCYPNCLAVANTYYDGVVVGGQSAYENGQNRGCQCCQDVYPP